MNTNSKISIRKRELRACKRCDFKFDTKCAKCPSCGQWDTPATLSIVGDETILLSDVSDDPIKYIQNTGPWDPCFSQYGGIATMSVTLIAGAPGAGKSTMALQMSDRIAEVTKREILYVSAEESKEQVKERAMRLQLKNLSSMRIYPMGASTDLGNILLSRKPSAIIVDSLPGLTPDLDQAVELCKRFKEYAVSLNSPVLVIDHITKDNEFAGLMALQHEVDTTIQFTVLSATKRDLMTIKNRFGPTRSVILNMTERGLILGLDDEDEVSEEDE